ncbi:hypothetical protein [Streptomyces tailanensis]|uniref:hypothetical protein n=1 Tax=Streptomyces tailanensis TaxID=2569858 RepID=UPI00122E8BE2|nr:hypothetical protein [Streptomyces tailanensis]
MRPPTAACLTRISTMGLCVCALTSPGTAGSPRPSIASPSHGEPSAGRTSAMTPSSTKMSRPAGTEHSPATGARSTSQPRAATTQSAQSA